MVALALDWMIHQPAPGKETPGAAAGRRSDAAHAVLTRPSRETTGNFFIDDEVLRTEGVTDFRSNRVDPELPDTEVAPDFFV